MEISVLVLKKKYCLILQRGAVILFNNLQQQIESGVILLRITFD